MMVNSRSNDSALARKGMLSSKAASNVRRAMPVTDRCQPRSAFTRRVRPPPRGAPPPAWRRGGGSSPPSAGPPSRRGRGAAPPLLPLVLALRPHPFLQLAPQLGRQLRVVEHDVLKIGRKVDLDRLALGEVAERVGRQRRGPVLHRAAQAVPAARVGRQRLEGIEVEL